MMKKIIALLGASGLVLGMAYAQPDMGKRGEKPPAERSEVEAKAKERFGEMDANNDGRLTASEMEAFHEAKRQERKEERKEKRQSRFIERVDANEDGVINEAEFVGARVSSFDRIDTDGDGVISKDEHEQARKHKRGPRKDG